MARRGVDRVLQIHLPDRWWERITREEPAFRWALHARGRRRCGVTRLAELPSADEIILVLPVSRVGLVRAQLPAGPAAELQLPVSPGETHERLASRMRIPGLRVRVEGITTGGAAPAATIRVGPDGG